jgi:hypothetical protein|tara:strand:+ start:2117 stop:2437 length:321 start_codon:yes stop_codon:yes gene_type:complete
MATFLNATLDAISDVETIGYTSTSDSTIILSILTANRDGSLAADITVSQYSAGGSRESFLAFTVPCPADANLEILSNKYILPSGKSLRFSSSASGFLDATLSLVEV